jgi:molecular chaperone DnaK
MHVSTGGYKPHKQKSKQHFNFRKKLRSNRGSILGHNIDTKPNTLAQSVIFDTIPLLDSNNPLDPKSNKSNHNKQQNQDPNTNHSHPLSAPALPPTSTLTQPTPNHSPKLPTTHHFNNTQSLPPLKQKFKSKMLQISHNLSPISIPQRSIHMWQPEVHSTYEILKIDWEKIDPNRGDTVGIKLGPTNLCISHVTDNGVVLPVKHRDESIQTPAAISLNADGYTLFGKVAMENQLLNPEGTIYDFVRFFGRKSSDSINIKDQQLVPYTLDLTESEVGFKMWDKRYTPGDIISLFLAPMRYIINRNVFHVVDQCVLTVPVTFTQEQRDLYEDAFKKNGFIVKDVLLEPIAAAMAYGTRRTPGQRIAVWDMGGTTFSFSLLEVLSDRSLHIKSTKGTQFLGGVDFDGIITDWILNELKIEFGIDFRTNEISINRIKLAAKEAKEALSIAPDTIIDLPFIHIDQGGPKHFKTKLHRVKYNEMALPYLWRTMQFLNQAFEESEWDVSQINEIILAGGMARWPLPKSLLIEYFKPTLKHHKRLQQQKNNLNKNSTVIDSNYEVFNQKVNIKDFLPPDELFSIGAANHGSNLKFRHEQFNKMTLNPLTLGFSINSNGEMNEMITINRTLPARVTKRVIPNFFDQSRLSIDIYQGEHLLTKYNRYLGSVLFNVPFPERAHGLPIDVTFDVDKSGNLSVLVKDAKDWDGADAVAQTFGSVHLHGFSEIELAKEREFSASQLPNQREELRIMQAYEKAQVTYHQISSKYNRLLTKMTKEQAITLSRHLHELYEVLNDPKGKTSFQIGQLEENCYEAFHPIESMWFQNTTSNTELGWPNELVRRSLTDHYHGDKTVLGKHYKPDYSWYSYKFKMPLRAGLTRTQRLFLDELTKSGRYGPNAYKEEMDWKLTNLEDNWRMDITTWSPFSQQLKSQEDKPYYYQSGKPEGTLGPDVEHPDFKTQLPRALQDKLSKYEHKFVRKMKRRENRLEKRKRLLDAGTLRDELSELSQFEVGEFVPPAYGKILQNEHAAAKLKRREENKLARERSLRHRRKNEQAKKEWEQLDEMDKEFQPEPPIEYPESEDVSKDDIEFLRQYYQRSGQKVPDKDDFWRSFRTNGRKMSNQELEQDSAEEDPPEKDIKKKKGKKGKVDDDDDDSKPRPKKYPPRPKKFDLNKKMDHLYQKLNKLEADRDAFDRQDEKLSLDATQDVMDSIEAQKRARDIRIKLERQELKKRITAEEKAIDDRENRRDIGFGEDITPEQREAEKIQAQKLRLHQNFLYDLDRMQKTKFEETPKGEETDLEEYFQREAFIQDPTGKKEFTKEDVKELVKYYVPRGVVREDPPRPKLRNLPPPSQRRLTQQKMRRLRAQHLQKSLHGDDDGEEYHSGDDIEQLPRDLSLGEQFLLKKQQIKRTKMDDHYEVSDVDGSHDNEHDQHDEHDEYDDGGYSDDNDDDRDDDRDYGDHSPHINISKTKSSGIIPQSFVDVSKEEPKSESESQRSSPSDNTKSKDRLSSESMKNALKNMGTDIELSDIDSELLNGIDDPYANIDESDNDMGVNYDHKFLFKPNTAKEESEDDFPISASYFDESSAEDSEVERARLLKRAQMAKLRQAHLKQTQQRGEEDDEDGDEQGGEGEGEEYEYEEDGEYDEEDGEYEYEEDGEYDERDVKQTGNHGANNHPSDQNKDNNRNNQDRQDEQNPDGKNKR